VTDASRRAQAIGHSADALLRWLGELPDGRPHRRPEDLVMLARLTPRPLAAVLAVLLAVLGASALSSSAAPAASAPKPTVVIVHGAFADASGWGDVISRLQQRGYQVIAPANPLRGVASDAAYIRSFLATIDGPIIVVGHSYGGMVITNAATGNPNVKALVYVAAYAPDEGDTIGSLEQLAPGGGIGPATLTLRPFPAPDGSQEIEGYITTDAFRRLFAADLPPDITAAMAASQRPAALSTLGEPSGLPAWKSIPSWYLIPGRDNAIGTAVERIMAQRIGAHTVEVEGASHAVMISHPDETAQLILRAARSAH
jgi:pimeloyl-ACP methyl ester carboxylesterase